MDVTENVKKQKEMKEERKINKDENVIRLKEKIENKLTEKLVKEELDKNKA